MSVATELLAELTHSASRVQDAGSDLTVKAPSGALKPELIDRLKKHKRQIVDHLREAAGRCAEPLANDANGISEYRRKADRINAFFDKIRNVAHAEQNHRRDSRTRYA